MKHHATCDIRNGHQSNPQCTCGAEQPPTNSMPETIWASKQNQIICATEARFPQDTSYTRTDLMEQQLACLQRQRDMALAMLTQGKTFTDQELKQSGLGMELETWSQQQAKVAAEKLAQQPHVILAHAEYLKIEMEELTAIIAAAMKAQ